MVIISRYLSQTGVARRLRLTSSRVRQLDAELRPERLDGGAGRRIYDPGVVDAYAARLAERRAARQGQVH